MKIHDIIAEDAASAATKPTLTRMSNGNYGWRMPNGRTEYAGAGFKTPQDAIKYAQANPSSFPTPKAPTKPAPAKPTPAPAAPTNPAPVTPTPAPEAPKATPTAGAETKASPKVKSLFESVKSRVAPHSVKINGKNVSIAELPGVARAVTKMSIITIRILKYTTLINFLYQWWGTREVIEDMDKREHAFEPGEKDAVLRMAYEEIVVSLAASSVMSNFILWFLRIIKVGKITEFAVGGVLAIFTGGAAIPEEILFFLGQQAVLLAIQQWLQTPDGRKLIASIVISLDPLLVESYNSLVGNFFGKIKSIVSEKGNAAAAKALGDPQKTLVGNAGGVATGAATQKPQTDPRTDSNNGAAGATGSNTANGIDSYTPLAFNNKWKAAYGTDKSTTGVSDADRDEYYKKYGAGKPQ
jgi:hypothetical protein